MAFSGALTLTDLNDYLGPSQACIKPVEGKDAPTPEPLDDETSRLNSAQTQIAVESSGVYETSVNATSANGEPSSSSSAPRARTKLEAAEISLNDCLACSGCVTSAESVLIGMQSLEEVRKVVEENATVEQAAQKKIVVASIAPQCLASLSAKYSLNAASSSDKTSFIPLRSILARVRFFLKDRFGFEAVLDTTFARHVALREHRREFLQRKAAGKEKDGQLPMLASACPGWICYAEKTHGELLPFISRTKSPQQVAGTMLKKDALNGRRRTTSSAASASVYHVAVMPCYDKKLEASRADFFDEVLGSRDVDCVITTGELDRLMMEEGFDIAQPVPNEGRDAAAQEQDDLGIPTLLDHPGSSSGGYLFDLLEGAWRDHAAEHARSSASSPPQLSTRIVRTSDFTEYTLRSPWTNEILFRGAHCYGFRNLQNLVRKVQKQTGVRSRKGAAAGSVNGERVGAASRGRGVSKRGGGMMRRGRGGAAGVAATANGGASPEEEEEARGYDYVEVMACPSGCVNGGGQIRPPTGEESSSSSGGNNGISMAISSGLVESTEAQVDAAPVPPPPQTNGKGKGPLAKLDLDPEGYSSGWSTPRTDVSSTGGMDVDTQEKEEAALKQGWKGTSKEWVRRVEEAYWSAGTGEGEIQRTGPTTSGEALQATLTRRREAKALALGEAVDSLADEVVRDMMAAESGNEDEEERRCRLLRTDYRAVQDEAVSGLAVQW
ncbi:iron hydrogenase [Jaminaea rosea]|uniref:Iron hydrogenase n=1 Tax=Jaminaea rosea TaxID=1569628 RepID=A0A316UNF1_9BASI|nr:iron hydrogenase [Jaminaea rosea]PWN26806.1 iron hydrogenase [Jaminaea rosea]